MLETAKTNDSIANLKEAKKNLQLLLDVKETIRPREFHRINFDYICKSSGCVKTVVFHGNQMAPQHLWDTALVILETHLRAQVEQTEAACREAMKEALATKA